MQAKTFDRATLDALVARAFGGPPAAVEPMVGGASSRKYFRVTGPGGERAVVMFVPDGLTPEEASKETNTRWPFLVVHDLLMKARIDVHLDAGCDIVLVCPPALVEDSLRAMDARPASDSLGISSLLGRGAGGWDGLLADARYDEARGRVTAHPDGVA